MSKKKPLETYKKKRNFQITKEPRGKIGKTQKKKKLSFVIQEHHARRLHYDFRLEWEGVLKSWAVPKGPSKIAGEKRLAVQTEDHPLEYGKFSGTIPEGEYGAGEVFIWDSGSWEPIRDPEESLRKGHLDFKLKGKKLTGEWSLIRTQLGKDEKKNNWLLIKKKETKTNKKEINDPWPGFIPPQLPRLVGNPPEGKNWIHEIKFDGYRIQAQVKNGICRLLTRTGLDWSNAFPHILNEINKLKIEDGIFDGEIVALDTNGKSHFQKLQNSFKAKKDHDLVFYLFDLLYLNGEDLRDQPLTERKKILKEVLPSKNKILLYSEDFTDAENFFRVSCEYELEGIVSKLGDATYKSGRSDLWMKSKCSKRQEFVIGGYTLGEGGRKNLGALILGVYEKDTLKYVGKVGTGMSRDTLSSLKSKLKKIEIDSNPFSNLKKNKNIHWVKPTLVCEVSFANWTTEGFLRAPVFKGLREDKPSVEVLHEEVSSPDKILFKKEKITKKKVNEYYQFVSKLMLPYMKDRPLTLVRCPEGTNYDCFYQKHFNNQLSTSFHPVKIKENKGIRTYVSISTAKGLRDLIQLNAFEIHSWNCNVNDLDHPDQFIFDLDPGPDVAWREVIKAAFELKRLLKDLGLESFVKLSGGKGIHIHVPVEPIYSWDQIKSFSQLLVLELENKSPDKYVSKMAKNLRKGRIFIDYLRNAAGATAVVPYSLRAREQSSVAIPLEWSELKRVKSPDYYQLDKAINKLKRRKKDPWEGMLRIKQRIELLEIQEAA